MIRTLALALALPLAAAQPALPTLREVVERFDAAQAKAETLQAPFTLTIRRALLRTPTVLKGQIFIQGSDFVHFTFAPPEDVILHLTPKSLTSYSPKAQEGEHLKIGIIKNANRRFLGLGQKLSYLSDYCQIALKDGKELPGTLCLNLTPRSLSIRKWMQGTVIWVDRETYLPRQIHWIERGGDAWQLELGAVQVNQPLPASVTGFKVPPGVALRSGFSFLGIGKK